MQEEISTQKKKKKQNSEEGAHKYLIDLFIHGVETISRARERDIQKTRGSRAPSRISRIQLGDYC